MLYDAVIQFLTTTMLQHYELYSIYPWKWDNTQIHLRGSPSIVKQPTDGAVRPPASTH